MVRISAIGSGSARRLGISAALIAAAFATQAASAVSFFDGVFNDPDWTLSNFVNATGVGSSSAAFQMPVGGNPNEYRIVRHNLVVTAPGNGQYTGVHLKNTAIYNPATQGAITSIDYSEDSINFLANVPGNGQGSGLAIYQAGKFYVQRTPILVMPYAGYSNWTANTALGLVATDLHEIDITGFINPFSNPDFSAAGAPMQFGFWRGNSGNGSYNTECGIDNWHVNIVPAPGAAALIAMGGLVAARRRR